MCKKCAEGLDGVVELARAAIGNNEWTMIHGMDGHTVFTAGLTERGWPELVVTGLAGSKASPILADYVLQLMRRNVMPQVGSTFRVEGKGYSLRVALRPFADRSALDVLEVLYQERGYEALHLVPQSLDPAPHGW